MATFKIDGRTIDDLRVDGYKVKKGQIDGYTVYDRFNPTHRMEGIKDTAYGPGITYLQIASENYGLLKNLSSKDNTLEGYKVYELAIFHNSDVTRLDIRISKGSNYDYPRKITFNDSVNEVTLTETSPDSSSNVRYFDYSGNKVFNIQRKLKNNTNLDIELKAVK